MTRFLLIALLLLAPFLHSAPVRAEAGDPVRGKRVFGRCIGCHSLNGEIKIGPPLSGIAGRKAASVPGYTYSKALIAFGQVWTAENLDRFLTAPRQMVPGTMMVLQIPDARDRADLIAYLQTLPAVAHPSPQR